MSAEQIDPERLEEVVQNLARERQAIQTAVADARMAADMLARAARSANETAGWIAHEVSRMRR